MTYFITFIQLRFPNKIGALRQLIQVHQQELHHLPGGFSSTPVDPLNSPPELGVIGGTPCEHRNRLFSKNQTDPKHP